MGGQAVAQGVFVGVDHRRGGFGGHQPVGGRHSDPRIALRHGDRRNSAGSRCGAVSFFGCGPGACFFGAGGAEHREAVPQPVGVDGRQLEQVERRCGHAGRGQDGERHHRPHQIVGAFPHAETPVFGDGRLGEAFGGGPLGRIPALYGVGGAAAGRGGGQVGTKGAGAVQAEGGEGAGRRQPVLGYVAGVEYPLERAFEDLGAPRLVSYAGQPPR